MASAPSPSPKSPAQSAPFASLPVRAESLAALMLQPHHRRWGFVDGELYAHGRPLESISGAVRKLLKPETATADVDALAHAGVAFHIFDGAREPTRTAMDAPFASRAADLDTVFASIESAASPWLARVPIIASLALADKSQAEAEAELRAIAGDLVSSGGFEGAVLRAAGSAYEPGKRSHAALKYKFWEEDEFEIVGTKSGQGREAGCVIWAVRDAHTGAVFDVRPRGSLDSRRLENPDAYIGALLTVRHYGRTQDDGLPRFAVGIGLRQLK